MGGESDGADLLCGLGHLNRTGLSFCTTCGEPLQHPAPSEGHPPGAKRERTRPGGGLVLAVAVAVATLLGVVGAAYAVGKHSGHDTASPPSAGAPKASPFTSATSSSTATENKTTTSTAPPSTTAVTTSAPNGGRSSEFDAARSAAVVYFTYGVTATGYPAFEEVIAPSARPAVDSMIIGPDYRNAGCSQIVESIVEDPLPNPPTYGWDLTLRYQCPDGQPASSNGAAPLPLTEDLYVETTVTPAPTGGYWATQVQIVDNN